MKKRKHYPLWILIISTVSGLIVSKYHLTAGICMIFIGPAIMLVKFLLNPVSNQQFLLHDQEMVPPTKHSVGANDSGFHPDFES